MIDEPSISEPTDAASPRKVALASWLQGGSRPRIDGARVLEVGCRDGANLLALAHYDRESTFVGVDVDDVAVSRATAAAREICLENVRFITIELDAPPDLGAPFDVVLVRDFVARIGEHDRTATLSAARARLADGGVLYVDHPTAPGHSLAAEVRSMLAPTAGEGSFEERMARVKTAATTLRAMLAKSGHPYAAMLGEELERVASSSSARILRDVIDGPRAVLRHRDVVALASSVGLRFVGDAEPHRASAVLPEELRIELERLGLRDASLDQAADVLRCRAWRASIFCRDDAPIAQPPGAEVLDELHLHAAPSPVSPAVRLGPGIEEAFQGARGERIASSDPLFKAAMIVLHAAHPKPLRFADVVSRAVMRLRNEGAEGEPSDDQLAGFAHDIWTLYRGGAIDLLLDPRIPSESGEASLHALARFEARRRESLTTPLHTQLSLSPFDAVLVRALAEGVDRSSLADVLAAVASSGELPIEIGGARVTDPVLLDPMMRGLADRSLVKLARAGLMDGETR